MRAGFFDRIAMTDSMVPTEEKAQQLPQGPLAKPGEYTVTLSQRVRGVSSDIATESFAVKPLFNEGLVTDDRDALLAFQMRSDKLYRAVDGADGVAGEIENRINHLLKAATDTPAADERHATALRALNARMQELRVLLDGDTTVTSRNEQAPLSLSGRVGFLLFGHWDSQAAVGANYEDSP